MFQQPLPSASKFKQNFNYGMTVTEEAQSGWFCKVSLIKISEVRHHAQILKNTQVHRKNKKKRNLLILLQRALLRKGESELQPYKTNTFKAPSTWKARVYLTELLFQDRACIFVMPSPFPSSFLLQRQTLNRSVLLPNPAKLGHQVSARDNRPLQASNEWKSVQHNTNTGGRIRGL